MSNSGTELADYLYPFPEPNDVFAVNVEQHRRHLVPLISLDAAQIDSSWTGRLHIVSPKESYDGMVGDYCPEFHTDWCKSDVLAFEVGDDGRYTFQANFRYFLTERGVLAESPAYLPSLLEGVREHYEHVEVEFAKTREFYLEHGVLNPNSSRQPDRKDDWISISSDFSALNVDNLEQDFGNDELRYVASVTGYSYYHGGPSCLHLYFEPIARIAVIQLDHD